jgi:hypothetical protein
MGSGSINGELRKLDEELRGEGRATMRQRRTRWRLSIGEIFDGY